jgi:hypothetical protein
MPARSSIADYRGCLSKFMSFRDGVEYGKDHTFSEEELLEIVPEDICLYMKFKSYNNCNPDEDSRPIHIRSSTLCFIKKALSYFMPRKRMLWDPIRKEGNPTKSSEVNEFIKKVMKCEVRKEGAKSHARRPIEYDEFINVLDLVRGNIGLKLRKYLLCSVLTMQWHLIARIDDMMKLKFENIQVGENNFTLICKMRWSKNITEERDAPEQIILGSMDFRICPFDTRIRALHLYLCSCSMGS